MVQQTIDSIVSEYGMGTTESESSIHDKQQPVPVKKTVLRDLQNVPKDRPTSNAPRVSGIKRPLPEQPMSPPQHQSPSSSAANAQLVYVRRKSEADAVRNSTCDNASINAECQVSRKLSHHEASIRPIPQTKETKVYCVPAFAPFPVAASTIPPGKPSVPVLPSKSGTGLPPAGANGHPHTSSTVPCSLGLKYLHWEERFHQLQLLLRNLDQSEHEDYIQMLRSLSSVELSRLAVELEKRSIQLSLEEAKELQHVGRLNVLGKSVKQFKVPSTQED
ncbi:hypothetical protein ACFX2G_035949 [Malus domestica]